ncbi:MAG: glycogen-binding domain-containing protein [Spirochaetota bacterium]
MEIKRLFLSTFATLCLLLGAAADVAIKDLGGGAVEITFSYKDDVASEMGVIGSFDNWTVPGEAMAKNAAGLWEFKLKALATDELQYKFYSKGTWIFDFKAPDKKDDGFGGNNGLIVVADVLAGTGNKASGAVAATGPVRKKVTFGTITWLESASSFSSAGKTFAPIGTAINARSTLMFYGDMVPNMPGRFELTYFNGSFPIYTASSLDAKTGLQNLGAALIFNPFYQLGGNAKPVIDKFVFGATSPGLVFETGMGNAYVPLHSSILWTTVQDYLISGSGYSSFRLGAALKQFGDLAFDAAFVPNKSLDGYYGYYSFARATLGGLTAELQYDLKSSATSDALAIFQNIPRQDLILGFADYLDQISIEGQVLLSSYLPGGAIDTRPVTDKLALGLKLGYVDFFEVYRFDVSYRYRGFAAQMLYADNATVLGNAETQAVKFDGSLKLGHWVTAKLGTEAEFSTSATSNGNIAVSLIPGTALDFSIPARRTLIADLYGAVSVNTKPSVGTGMIALTKAAAKVEVGDVLPGLVEAVDFWYGLDRGTTMFNSLLVEAKLVQGLKAQLACGLRTGTGISSPYGAAIGASWSTPAPQAKSPLLYAQLGWNLNPWDAIVKGSYDFNDSWRYLPDGGISKADGSSSLRLGVSWNF